MGYSHDSRFRATTRPHRRPASGEPANHILRPALAMLDWSVDFLGITFQPQIAQTESLSKSRFRKLLSPLAGGPANGFVTPEALR